MISPDKLCQKRGCPCEATHLVKVCVPALGDPAEASLASATLSVRLCEAHLEEDDPQGWVTGDTGQYVRPLLAIAAKSTGETPDFARAWTVGVPLDSQEARSLAVSVAPRLN